MTHKYMVVIEENGGPAVCYSKVYKSTKTAEKWVVEHFAYINFDKYKVYVLYDDHGTLKRYFYIDSEVFNNLKEKYKKGDDK